MARNGTVTRMRIAIACVFLCAAGCDAKKERVRSGARYENLDQIRLIHPPMIFGSGWNVWLSSGGQGYAWNYDRPGQGENGMQVRWYRMEVTKDQVSELTQLLDRHDFFSIEIPDRVGVPDETRPGLEVRLKDGRTATVWKWAGDKNPDFDAIQKWLEARAEEAGRGPVLFDGPVAQDWAPEGFSPGP